MSSNALHRRMTSELLEKIKDWPEDALRSVKDAIDQMLAKATPGAPKGLSSDDAFGSWVGPETADEIMAMIRSARTPNPDREAL